MTDTHTKRATLDELLEFANKVRNAGGGNPIDALMPAVPADPKQCLIAKNLNFNCWVDAGEYGDEWTMWVTTRELAQNIAKAVGCDTATSTRVDTETSVSFPVYGIVLPKEIGEVAQQFDSAWDDFNACREDELQRLQDEDKADYLIDEEHVGKWQLKDGVAVPQIPVQDPEMFKMIDASVKEAINLATAVNADGEIII